MKVVEGCPRNNNTFEMRLQSKRCTDFPLCTNERLVYHCVRYEDNLVEVCAPEGDITGNINIDYDGSTYLQYLQMS